MSIAEYLDSKEAATYLNMSVSSLRKYRDEIGYFQRDRKTLFRRVDLDRWIKNNMIAPGQESQSRGGRV